MAKILAVIFGLLLFVTNGFWIYQTIDLTVTEKYRQLNEWKMETRLAALTNLANYFVQGMQKEDMQRILKKLDSEFAPFEKEGHLNTPNLSFQLNADGTIKRLTEEY